MVTMPTDAATDPSITAGLVENKMNVARINCAHDNAETWLQIVNNIKTAAKKNNRSVKIAADLSGPKIRTGTLFQNGKEIKPNKKKCFLTLYNQDELLLLKSTEYYAVDETRKAVTCTLPEVLDMISVGDRIFFDDGKIEGGITEICKGYAIVKIVKTKLNGSKLRTEKGINVPDSNLLLPGLTEKDKEDFKFVAEHCDIVNLSFINTVQDLEDL